MIVGVQDIGHTQSSLALEFGNYWGGRKKKKKLSSTATSVASAETHLIPAAAVHVS